jgi:hypothetical protein
MNTSPQGPSAHYIDATRLLAVAESAGVDTDVARIAALAALGHAVLATVSPRTARRHRDAGQHGVHHGGGGVRERWITGTDEDG